MRIKKISQTTTTQAQISDGYSESKIDGYSCNYINNITKEVYSTTEVKTNKVWIDGKPIYRKIFEGTANIQQSGSSQPITNLPSDSETIINLYGYFKWSSYLQTFPIVWGTSSCSLRVVGKSIQYFSNFGIGTGTYIIISEYTKTTD